MRRNLRGKSRIITVALGVLYPPNIKLTSCLLSSAPAGLVWTSSDCFELAGNRRAGPTKKQLIKGEPQP